MGLYLRYPNVSFHPMNGSFYPMNGFFFKILFCTSPWESCRYGIHYFIIVLLRLFLQDLLINLVSATRIWLLSGQKQTL